MECDNHLKNVPVKDYFMMWKYICGAFLFLEDKKHVVNENKQPNFIYNNVYIYKERKGDLD